MGAELLGIGMAWEISGTAVTVTDSLEARGRIARLHFSQPRSLTEVEVSKAQEGQSKALKWVNRHAGVVGNELADYKAEAVAEGMSKRGVHTNGHKTRVQGQLEGEVDGVG